MPTEVPVIGDAKEGLAALLPLLHRKDDRSHLTKFQNKMGKWRAQVGELEEPADHGRDQQRFKDKVQQFGE
jgi:pyruvate dehydrogenase (quinone)/pyruvate oxidase